MAGILAVALLPPAAAQTTYRDVVAQVAPRVVKIFGAGGLARLHEYGTGFLVSGDGYIVTLWSHVLDSDLIGVVLDDGRRFDAELVAADPRLELAVLRIDATELPYFDLADQRQTRTSAPPGTQVLALSNMYGVAVGNEPVSVQHGVIAAVAPLEARRGVFESGYEEDVYILDCVSNNPGAAGGVVVTREGRLIGMIGRELRNAQTNTWVNYAIPVSQFREPVEQMIRGEYVAQRDPVEAAEVEPNFTPADFGLLLVPDVVERTPPFVDEVRPGSAAAAAGLQPDDLVLFADGELVASCEALEEIIGRLERGQTLELTVRRGDRLIEVQLQVE